LVENRRRKPFGHTGPTAQHASRQLRADRGMSVRSSVSLRAWQAWDPSLGHLSRSGRSGSCSVSPRPGIERRSSSCSAHRRWAPTSVGPQPRDELERASTRARPLQPIVCCPEFNPTALASARAPTDPRFDPAGIDIDDLYLAAIGEFAAKSSVGRRSEIIDCLRGEKVYQRCHPSESCTGGCFE